MRRLFLIIRSRYVFHRADVFVRVSEFIMSFAVFNVSDVTHADIFATKVGIFHSYDRTVKTHPSVFIDFHGVALGAYDTSHPVAGRDVIHVFAVFGFGNFPVINRVRARNVRFVGNLFSCDVITCRRYKYAESDVGKGRRVL